MFTRQLRIKNLFALLGMSFVASVGLVNCETWLPEPPSTCMPNEQQCTGTTLKVCGEDERWAEETRYCSEVAQVVAGGWHACARFTDGSVKCWGRNNFGQLGQENDKPLGIWPSDLGANLPAVNLGKRKTAKAIFAGGEHTCALLDDGTVKCWGNNESGQLGQINDLDSVGNMEGQMGDSLPTVDLGPGQTAEALSLGWQHTCALLNGGRVKCWGANESGQLGQGNNINVGGSMVGQLSAIELGEGKTATALASGDFHVCALLNDGNVKCWGGNGDGQLGLEKTEDIGYEPGQMGNHLPSVNLGNGMTATAISAGGNHTCALLNDGSVKCWGANDCGQLGQENLDYLGDGPVEMGGNLRPVDLGTGETATAISAGEMHTCVLLKGRSVKCWGRNDFGQLGLGRNTNIGDLPYQMGDYLPTVKLGTDKTLVKVAAGAYFTCASLSDGNVKCWGANESGQLGQGDKADRGTEANQMGDNLSPIKFW